ncbi:MAG: hypothetical protein AAFY60_20280, partial [Myxococcota bacterium]
KASPQHQASNTVAKPGSKAHGLGGRQGKGGKRKNRGQHCPVYLDGKPIALLSHAELPRDLEPLWLEQTRNLPFKPGEPRKTQTERVRRYRMVDYLKALDVPLDHLKALHMHHGRGMIAEVTGPGLTAHPDDVMFRFGGDVHGKTIPVLLDAAPVNRRFDHMVALTLYVERDPPTLDSEDKPTLNGQPVEGIAYAELPLKGGARVYVDDRLALILRRKMLRGDAKQDVLARILAAGGASPESVVYGVLIADEKRSDPMDPETLLNAPLTRNETKQFEIQLNGSTAQLDAVALYTSKPAKN